MADLPLTIYSAAQMRAIDAFAAEHLGIPTFELMSRAGAAAFELLRREWPQARRIAVLCGAGNNGGDAYVLALHARHAGLRVDVGSTSDVATLRGDAARAFAEFTAAGGSVVPARQIDLTAADVIVDGIFGTGIRRPITGDVAELIQRANAARRPVLALDIPSGLDADTGAVHGVALRAQRTLSFAGLKLGFFVGQGPEYVGTVEVYDLGLPKQAFEYVGAAAERIGHDEIGALLGRRSRLAHKGDHGRVLIVGGGPGMGGAAALAGEAALRAGAGLVTVACHASVANGILARRPELIVHPVEYPEDLEPLLAAADVVALGPGFGRSHWSSRLFAAVVRSPKPLVLDADGLNILAGNPFVRRDWVLTPHPGEAARLLSCSTADVQADRLSAARTLSTRFDATVVLKGAASIVLSPQGVPAIAMAGNPGMATAGMGDVLTGVIAGVAAQSRDLARSARVGVLAHALAGDRAARAGERGLIASDLFEHVRACLNP
jgi:NAD(P)H-hydrate epimerase